MSKISDGKIQWSQGHGILGLSSEIAKTQPSNLSLLAYEILKISASKMPSYLSILDLTKKKRRVFQNLARVQYLENLYKPQKRFLGPIRLPRT